MSYSKENIFHIRNDAVIYLEIIIINTNQLIYKIIQSEQEVDYQKIFSSILFYLVPLCRTKENLKCFSASNACSLLLSLSLSLTVTWLSSCAEPKHCLHVAMHELSRRRRRCRAPFAAAQASASSSSPP